MNIHLLAFGSRGDVQPFIALGLGLRRAGYTVSIGAAASFQKCIESSGLCFLPVQADVPNLLQSDLFPRGVRWEQVQTLLDETLRLAEGADALIFNPAAIFSAPHVAEKLGIPAIAAFFQPYLNPTGDFPAPGMPSLPFGRLYNRASYQMADSWIWAFLRERINDWRWRVLGLPPVDSAPFDLIRQQQTPILYAFSPLVLPRPAEWGAAVHVTGYWFLPTPAQWKPSPALAAFLNEGVPPVYVGFGSMANRDSPHTARIVMEALDRLGTRAVLVSGWGGMAVPTSGETDMLLLENVPHDWLFPQMAAIVHHGGAGTLGAGLRAGKPNVIVPFTGDQPFWGAQVQRLGVGPAPLPHAKLTVTALANALHDALHDSAMQARVAALGEQLRAEDGVGAALKIIEGVLGKPQGVNRATESAPVPAC